MVNCEICKKKLSIWSDYCVEDKWYHKNCWEKHGEEIKRIKLKEQEEKKIEIEKEKNRIQEYKRKCNQCGKVWHVLIGKEKQIATKGILDSLVGVGTALQGNIGASTQASRNADANMNLFDKLRVCPNCGSSDYSEEIIIFEKKNKS